MVEIARILLQAEHWKGIAEMRYEFRYGFMQNAVVEYARHFIDFKQLPLSFSINDAFAEMKREFTVEERNDWFAMYCMGGVPYPGQGGKV